MSIVLSKTNKKKNSLSSTSRGVYPSVKKLCTKHQKNKIIELKNLGYRIGEISDFLQLDREVVFNVISDWRYFNSL